jgi:hypothetical protein
MNQQRVIVTREVRGKEDRVTQFMRELYEGNDDVLAASAYRLACGDEQGPAKSSTEALAFQEFKPIPRLSRECIVSEKIDGTSCQVLIVPENWADGKEAWAAPADSATCMFLVGSRTRYITPADDNYGFAAWTHAHREELIWGLGHGRYFGEWMGLGINRNYGLKEKRWYLFNTNRWGPTRDLAKYPDDKPECCSVVPVLWQGDFRTERILGVMDVLQAHGSYAVPGYMNPEGIVIYHVGKGGSYFKKTFIGDADGKGSEA